MIGIARRAIAGTMAAVLSPLLAACLFVPGKFVSDLEVRRDGTFSYRYTGGIYVLPLALPNAKPTFTATACSDDEGGEQRPCTAAELATQKREFENAQAEKSKQDAQAAQAMFGGIDPKDPKAAEEIADRLRRQKGWKRVDYKGAGLFDVDFAISGRLDHDFAFPTVERFPMANAFVAVSLRQDGTVRIDAPGFVSSDGLGAGSMLMQGAMAPGSGRGAFAQAMDGTFTIRTDGAVLANNTEEGPRKGPAGQELTWTINARTTAAPMALVRLNR